MIHFNIILIYIGDIASLLMICSFDPELWTLKSLFQFDLHRFIIGHLSDV